MTDGTDGKNRTGGAAAEALTKRQLDTLRAIRDHMACHGEAPTMEELGERLGVTGPTAHTSVRHLLRKGYLVRRDRRKRGLAVVREPVEEIRRLVSVPVVGHVTAGIPNLAEENVVGSVSVDAYLVRHGTYFGLRVEGDSMTGAGIEDGDTVVVRWQNVAQDNEIVVARIGDEATVKRLRLNSERLALLPENPDYEPIEIDGAVLAEFSVIGPVVSVVRH